MFVVCNAIFGLTTSCSIPQIFAKLSEIALIAEILMFGRDRLISDPILIHRGVNSEHVAKFGDDRPNDSRDMRRKKRGNASPCSHVLRHVTTALKHFKASWPAIAAEPRAAYITIRHGDVRL